MADQFGAFRDFARKLISEESRRRDIFPTGPTPLALVYPNSYATGMSSLGYQTVYRLLNEQPLLQGERAFQLEGPFAAFCHTLESQRPLNQFRIVAFSLAYEMDYPIALQMLKRAGIPLLAQERTARDPLILMGGVATFYNPTVMAPVADFFFIGEAENIIPRFAHIYEEHLMEQGGKEALLQDLAQMEGCWVPGVHGLLPPPGLIRRQYVSPKECVPATSVCVTPNTHLEMFMVEVGRGCGRGCRFCAAGHLYHPFRYWPLEQIVEQVARYALPGDRIGLVGAALSDYRDLDLLCDELLRRGHKISLSSLRADRISRQLLQALTASDIQTVALAPEAGSERLRNAIRKNLREEQILEAAARIGESEIRQIKLYYMIGLPSEQPEDLQGIVDLTRKVAAAFCRKSSRREVRVSINAFVPKPWTPFQWAPMATEKEIKLKRNPVLAGLNRIEGVSAGRKSGKEEVLQALFSLGDQQVGRALVQAVQSGEDWQAILASFTEWIHRPKRLEESLPWDFIDNGLDKERLWRGREDSTQSSISA
jgi:radical SAM superfamily enzyme YgiQ (UPF0313 family)